MPRDPKCRYVEFVPQVSFFKPAGVRLSCLEEVILKVEEIEAIRLKDYLGMEQEECARNMQVSRPTFQRILMVGRQKIADALINGKAIRIEGGDYCLGSGYCRRRGRALHENDTCRLVEELSKQSKILLEGDEAVNRIAICASGDQVSSPVDDRFGRCPYLMIWDAAASSYAALANSGIEMSQGAGTGTVQELLQRGVGVVIANKVGPKAFVALQRAGIKVYSGVEGLNIEAALKKYQAGELKELETANN